MIRLNLEGRNALRKQIEEKLANYDGKERISLDRYVDLETLLFEEVSYKNKQGKRFTAKLPVWSGNFLAKIDLSKVSFENVSWSLLGTQEENLYEVFYKGYPRERFFFLTFGQKVNYSNTNANIDLDKSWESRNNTSNTVNVRNCDFSNVESITTGETHNYIIENTNLSGSGIQFIKSVGNRFWSCNLTDVVFGQRSIDLSDFFATFNACDLNYTGLRIRVDDFKNRSVQEKHDLTYLVKSHKLDGCYINGVKIMDRKEIEQNKSIAEITYNGEKEQLFHNVSSCIDDQIAKFSRK